MKTKILIAALAGFLVISLVAASTVVAANSKAKGEPKGPPDKAGEKAKAPDLEKIEFIHWRKGFGKPTCNNNGICEPELGEKKNCGDCKNGGNGEEPPPPTCYAFMGKYGKRYLKWADGLPITCVIDSTSPYELSEDFVIWAVSTGAAEWDWHTESGLFIGCTTGLGTGYKIQNYVNGISFDDYYDNPDIIAACNVWYSPATKQIVEFDIVFETDYTWGDGTANLSVMDLQNIATHELGHGLGLADVYELECSEVTMYGYSDYGETDKIDLAGPDTTGIQTLYGAPE